MYLWYFTCAADSSPGYGHSKAIHKIWELERIFNGLAKQHPFFAYGDYSYIHF